ncbi:Nif3-like dinuclear metal center hexameric protein [Myroides odoratus]|uniref:GTP cyclohydrolase 1 type 2 homolog n=1 Tax=Myroides odoratus TaxID=256 RepID=A0A9Q6Z521_MYROD|nr:Nif3-like dinuclear metal center hexameric protein [Myroides odoratus]EHQ43505.1 NGG1p interacting factor 3 protein, NIF3 [Myroides odoratus DSM 2801]EKB06172.1 YbgI/family dinuclear metal center protein [Myroides odoratus CIP 103059]QQU00836.1 Nif3-like dinuclear metal center hexameric protein [Myroides odoratus]WQD56921.1 Nif3-like dinuclear metal center hexameric protein [Myroides odoratus]STZ30784.1 metal-binding protein [Myroides odoratus]
MKVKNIIPILEELAPLGYAEDFDNVGLLVGSPEQEVSGILVCHDALENVVEEAIAQNCNFIVCFHPILFSGLKKITGKNYVERAVIKAIKNDIAIYAIHTALDNHQEGVNKIFCTTLGLEQTRILIPKEQYIQKLVTYVPIQHTEKVRQALFAAGAGAIGNYDHCSFISEGKGSFRGNEHSNPVIGQAGVEEIVEEHKVEVTYEKHLQGKVLSALFQAHPYEEVAYEVYNLANKLQNVGMGMIGELKEPMDEIAFLQMVKEKTGTGGIRHSALLNKPIQKVAVLGGSGSFAIKAALQQKADAFITADLKYHQFYEVENQLVLADIGHFESERYTKNYIVEFLSKKMPNFAVILSTVNTNPVNYL